ECFGQYCPEVCDDGWDNDGDSFVDCADTDCPPCPELCDDGLDNDRDGLVDCDDPDCAGDPVCAGASEICNNSLDDDGDGLIDCDDPDCEIDNDGDGYFALPCGNDCNDTNPNMNPGKPEVCDGKDNNCNGVIDEGIASTPTTCGVGACAATGTLSCVGGVMVDTCTPGTLTAEVCNGIDDNCNGVIDDDDSCIAPTATLRVKLGGNPGTRDGFTIYAVKKTCYQAQGKDIAATINNCEKFGQGITIGGETTFPVALPELPTKFRIVGFKCPNIGALAGRTPTLNVGGSAAVRAHQVIGVTGVACPR
ncbi:MAG TPA: putative metal-binding motif-containing protein, partial [Thermodesulfovibrionales bacterium]|nr:putative metal-binding motif-containing protein [Thermodesulfovibrionales bacterium]